MNNLKDSLVSIIIVNYNTCDLILRCIHSIYEKTIDIPFEIIVVDNNSVDESVSKIQHLFPNVIVIRNSENLGFSKACNIGVQFAKGKYLCFLNTDTMLVTNVLKEMMIFLKCNDEVGIVGPLILNPDMSIQQSITKINFVSNLMRLFRLKICTTNRTNSNFIKKYSNGYYLKKGLGLLGACLMVKKEVFDYLGGFDEKFFFTGEEGDFILNAMKNGWKVVFLPKSKIIHNHGATVRVLNLNERKKILYSYYFGILYFTKKNYGFLAYLIIKNFMITSFLLSEFYNKIRTLWSKNNAFKANIYKYLRERL